MARIALVVALALVAATCAADGGSDAAEPGGRRERTEVAGVDVTRHAVPLDEIHFDTFGRGRLTLAEATDDEVLGLLDAIPPLDSPGYQAADDADWLDDGDAVIGHVDAAGLARAFPHRILNFHEIVNDEFAGAPVLVSYCPLCRSGVVYDRRVGGRVLTFSNTSALHDNDLVMVDRETSTYWWQVAGRGIVGPLTDVELRPVPSTTMSWGAWRTLHPETLVLSRHTGHDRDYGRDPFAGYAERVDRGETPFPVGAGVLTDGRLSPGTLVVGVEVAGDEVAWPVDDLAGRALDVEVGGRALLVAGAGDGAAVVFERTVDGRPLTFEVAPGGFSDRETGTRWDRAGRATGGPLAGASLAPVASRSTFWFAYLASFPDVRLGAGR